MLVYVGGRGSDPQRADEARKEMHDAVQARRLAEIRKTQGHTRQADVAAAMGLPRFVRPGIDGSDERHGRRR